ncbi:MAG: aminotransferase class I/II-fold pyridoxal phosphate-dependent enzyme, partial [Bacteroidales bacterium]|nr:aminotransferase class I/II-fold pyridoxal phosphate-dependent enzyme [Bacteroidales bacterium]
MAKHLFHHALAQMNALPRLDNIPGTYKLDKNEHGSDINPAMKARVLQHLAKSEWNRYPSLNYQYIETRLSEYCHLNEGEIVLAPGAASILAALLNYFAINKLNIKIIQPSYAFLNYHCTAYNIPYTALWLDENFEYDKTSIPPLDEESVLILASPNNPTGSSISINKLKQILIKHPKSLIILDAVYQEYGAVDYATLVSEFDNLILIRSFSKAFPAAGVRLGYLCAQIQLAEKLRKLILPYSINHFALAYAYSLFENIAFFNTERAKIGQIITIRNEFYD